MSASLVNSEFSQFLNLIGLVVFISEIFLTNCIEKIGVEDLTQRTRIDLPSINEYEKDDYIQSDGIVKAGQAWVVENWVSADRYLTKKESGSKIYAGAKILLGKLRIESESIPTAVNSNFVPPAYRLPEVFIYLKIILSFLSVISFVFNPIISMVFGLLCLLIESCLILRVTKFVLILKLYLLGIYNKSYKNLKKISFFNRICVELDTNNLRKNWCLEKIEIMDSNLSEKEILNAILSISALGADQDIFREISRYLFPKIGEFFDANVDAKMIIANGLLAFGEYRMLIGDEEFLISNGVIINQSDLSATDQSEMVLYFCKDNTIAARLFFKDAMLLSLESFSSIEQIELKILSQQNQEAFRGLNIKGELSPDLHGEVLLNKVKSFYPAIVYSNSFTMPRFPIVRDYDYVTKKIESDVTYLLTRRFSSFSEAWKLAFRFNVIHYLLIAIMASIATLFGLLFYLPFIFKIVFSIIIVSIAGIIIDRFFKIA